MDITCAVVGCNSKWTLSSKLWFFRVTSNKKLLPLWLKVIKLNTIRDAMICSLHFKEDDIIERGGEKLLKRMVVPSYNIVGTSLEEKDDGSDDDENENLSTVKNTLLISKQNDANTNINMTAPQSTSSHMSMEETDDGSDDDENENLSTVKNTLLISKQNDANTKIIKTAPQTTSTPIMVMTYANLPRPRATVQYFERTRSIATQVRLKTEEEILLKKKIKTLNLRIKRREEKVGYLQTVFKMIKKNVKGTDMAYKLSCELENISNSCEIDENFTVSKAKPKETKSVVRDHNSDDEMNNGEEFIDYDRGTFVEVAHSPNLKRISNIL